MAENSEVLDFLRARFARLDERFDRVERKLDEVITCLAVVERDVAGLPGGVAVLKVDFASMQSRLDSIDPIADCGRITTPIIVTSVSAVPATITSDVR